MANYLFKKTKDLPSIEIKRRIKSLSDWNVKSSKDSILEYKKELMKRGL